MHVAGGLGVEVFFFCEVGKYRLLILNSVNCSGFGLETSGGHFGFNLQHVSKMCVQTTWFIPENLNVICHSCQNQVRKDDYGPVMLSMVSYKSMGCSNLSWGPK